MHKLLLFMRRRPGFSPEQFRAYYEDRHVPLCMKYMAGAERYVRRYLDADDHGPQGFDVITELWFRDRATLDIVTATLARDGMPADVIADEHNLFDRAALRWAAVTECETELS